MYTFWCPKLFKVKQSPVGENLSAYKVIVSLIMCMEYLWWNMGSNCWGKWMAASHFMHLECGYGQWVGAISTAFPIECPLFNPYQILINMYYGHTIAVPHAHLYKRIIWQTLRINLLRIL